MTDSDYLKSEFLLVLKEYIYLLPSVVYILMIPVILLAALFTFSFFARNSELIAIQANGVSSYRLFSLLILTTLFLGGIVLIISDRLTEKYFEKAIQIKYVEIRKDRSFSFFKTGKLWYRSDNIILNIDSFDHINNTFHNVTAYTVDESFKLISHIDAHSCRFSNNQWVLYDGMEFSYENTNNVFPTINKFHSKTIKINKKPDDFGILQKRKFGFYSIKDLKEIIKKNEKLGVSTLYYKTQLHSKFSQLFSLLVMIFLAIPFAFTNYKKISNTHNIVVGLAISFIFGSFHSTFTSLGSSGVLYPFIAAWGANIIFIFIGAYIFWHKREEWQF